MHVSIAFKHHARTAMLLCAGLFFQSAVLGRSPTAQFDQWELTYPEPSGSWFYAAAWGEPGCVAVGMHGDISFSADGVSWRQVRSPLQHAPATKDCTLFDVCYGNGIYVAVGGLYNKAYAVRSADGVHWETIDPGVSTYLRGVCHGGGRFVAVVGSEVVESIDGRIWTKPPPSPGIWRIVHGDGRWVGISKSGEYHWTDDLATWTTVQGDARSFSQRNICHGAGRFVSVGSWGLPGSSSIIQWSETGTNWHFATIEGSPPGDLLGCTFANDRFVVSGSDYQTGYHPRSTLVSTNGASWSAQRTVTPSQVHVPNGYFLDVAGADGRPFVAVGNHGVIWSSTNATDWTVVDPRPREYLNDIEYANGSYVAVGGKEGYIGYPPGTCSIFSSTNGIDWRSYVPYRPDTLWDVTYGKGCWVATGDDGGIFTSTDAIHWADRSWPDTLNDLEHVVYGNGRFIAFSAYRDRIYHSEDTILWAISDGAPVANVRCAGFFNDQFMACGENGLILFSTNGLDWIDHSISEDIDIIALAYGKGRYVLSGWDHFCYVPKCWV
jgi:hypothetical protein